MKKGKAKDYAAADKKGGGKKTTKSDDKSAPKAAGHCSMPMMPLRPIDPLAMPNRERLIRVVDRKWVNNTVLRYCFLDKPGRWRGSDADKEAVRKASQAWKGLPIGLVFREVDDARQAEIRIGFDQRDGSWSYVGRDAIDHASAGRVGDGKFSFTHLDSESPDKTAQAITQAGAAYNVDEKALNVHETTVRFQGNSLGEDDVDGILYSTREGLSYGCGDAVIGVNPATDTPESTAEILRALDDLMRRNQIPTQHCVLSHVTVQMQVLALLDDMVCERGMGLILISHDLNLVASFCDRILVMYGGRVMEVLKAGQLQNAQHAYTRGLLNCIPELDRHQDVLPVLQRNPAWLTD